MWKRYLQPERLYIAFLLAILCCLFAYGIPKIFGFSIYPDEFGYWASAARLLGYDWSDITSLGSYYSFGYGLLLLPILAWVEDPVMAYRAAVGCNLIMAGVSLLLIWEMAKKLFPDLGAEVKVFFSGIAIFYPPVLFYMQTTMAETAILFAFVVSCFLFLGYLEKPGIIRGLLLAGVLGGLFFLHMRTVGVLIAAGIVLVFVFGKMPAYRKSLLAVIGGGGLILFISLYSRGFFIEELYGKAEISMLQINDLSSQFGKIRALLRWDRIGLFLISYIGKIFYLGLSSFGIFYWGMLFLVKKIIGLIKTRNRQAEIVDMFYLFVFLVIIGQVGINAIFMMRAGTIDILLYGRYNDFLLPVLMPFGLYQMMQSKYPVRITAGILAIQIPVVLLLNHWIGLHNITDVRGYFSIGLSYMISEMAFEPSSYIGKAFAFGSVLTLGCAGILLLIRKKKQVYWIFSMLILLQVLLGVQAIGHYIIPFNDANNLDLRIVEIIKKEKAEKDPEMIHIYEEGLQYIDFLQFQFPEDTIKAIKEMDIKENGIKEDGIKENDKKENDIKEYDIKASIENLRLPSTAMVIVDSKSKYRDSLQEQYRNHKEGERFCLYYNEELSSDNEGES